MAVMCKGSFSLVFLLGFTVDIVCLICETQKLLVVQFSSFFPTSENVNSVIDSRLV